MQVTPDIIAEYTRQTGDQNKDSIKKNGLFDRVVKALGESGFLRLQPKLSMHPAIRFSNTAMTVEKLAKVINRKNNVPHRRPPAIFTKTFGNVTKISDGPASG